MSIRVPQTSIYEYPLWRISVMPPGSWTQGSQPWIVLDMAGRERDGLRYYGREHGYEIDSVERCCIPDVGTAQFHMDFGTINHIVYTVNGSAGTSYDANDLTGYDVRIQVASPPPIPKPTGWSPTWSTVFAGTVIAQTDLPFVGIDHQGGRRTYVCSDLLWRTQRWPMNRHSVNSNGQSYNHCPGHPGYNYEVNGYYRRVIGNREATGVTCGSDPYGDLGSAINRYFCHTWVGSGGATVWTDYQALRSALVSSRAAGEPILDVVGSTDLLQSNVFAWPVGDGENCWSFINRVLDRKRGRGLAFLDWTTDTLSTLTPVIRLSPQIPGDISYLKPSNGSPVSFQGASSRNSVVSVDLSGDLRVPEGGVSIASNETAKVDYLESQGEPIQVLGTFSAIDSTLVPRWTSVEEAAFLALDPTKPWQRTNPRWKWVFQRFNIPDTFNFMLGDGNGGTKYSINFHCADNGSIIPLPDLTQKSKTNSPLLCRLTTDIPIYEGYDYTQTPAIRWDNADDTTLTVAPNRLPAFAMIRSSGPFYTDASLAGASLNMDEFGIYVQFGADQQQGTRMLAGPSNASVGGSYDKNALVVSACLQLSNRVRMATAAVPSFDASSLALRRRTITYSGIHLWLGASNAIWSLYQENSGQVAQQPYRFPASSTDPTILRDDRDYLAQWHNLAWAWYGITHRTGQWTIRDCGFLGSFWAFDGSTPNLVPQLYPEIGDLVSTIDCGGGASYIMNAPVTRVRWDQASGATTWVLDWYELDVSR